MLVIDGINFPKSSWKPVQTGVKLSTTSMICLVQEVLSSPNIKFILTARFTQDALENLFSQIRGQGVPHPQPIQFRQALRLVCLGHFMMIPNSSNYEEDNTPMLLDFIEQYDSNAMISEDKYTLGIPSSVVEEASCTALNVCESSGLYYLAEWAVFKELKTLASNTCITAIRVQHVSLGQFSESLYTHLKSYDCKGNLENTVSVNTYSTNFLCHPSRTVLQLLNNAEVVFRSNSL